VGLFIVPRRRVVSFLFSSKCFLMVSVLSFTVNSSFILVFISFMHCFKVVVRPCWHPMAVRSSLPFAIFGRAWKFWSLASHAFSSSFIVILCFWCFFMGLVGGCGLVFYLGLTILSIVSSPLASSSACFWLLVFIVTLLPSLFMVGVVFLSVSRKSSIRALFIFLGEYFV
jgi:hypothetical protein